MIMRMFFLAGTVVLTALSAQAGDDHDHAPIGEAIRDVPIFDAHIHYKEPAWERFPPERILGLMDDGGVAMGLVSSSPDEGTIMLWEHAPSRIVPELRPYHGSAGSSNWTDFEDMPAYLEERLNTYPHEGIGEFHIRGPSMQNEELFREIIDMAKARNLYLHVHSGAEPIRWLFEMDPEVKVIWAHAGLGESASNVHALMSEFPTLLAETSLREYLILGFRDEIDPEWKDIIFDFQDRLMVGSDTWINEQWDNYEQIIASNRRWLSLLPREVAEKIAYKNAERVFGREISMEQIGER